MTCCWRLAAGADPALHTWQGEYVVHHALSNDTHRLSEPAGRILLELRAAGTQGAREPGRSFALSDDEAHATLTALAELGFVTQC
jgi:hypothetical protein